MWSQVGLRKHHYKQSYLEEMEFPAELFQILKDDAVKVLHTICQQIWKPQQWPQDWKRSVFIPIPNKGNAKECSNCCTIAHISHVSQRRQWHPIPVLLPGKSHGRRSLEGCSPWGRWELDKTERLHFHFSLSCIAEGNGNPFQCSCLENPRDGGDWWAAVYGITQNWTWLSDLACNLCLLLHSVCFSCALWQITIGLWTTL